MVSFKEEMRKEVEQFNWCRRKTEQEKERKHVIRRVFRMIRKESVKKKDIDVERITN